MRFRIEPEPIGVEPGDQSWPGSRLRNTKLAALRTKLFLVCSVKIMRTSDFLETYVIAAV